MYGNGQQATSFRIRVLSPALTRNIPSPGLGITRCSVAAVGPLVRTSFITLIETSTHPTGATYGRGSALVLCSLRKNEDWNSYTGSPGLTLRKSDHCGSLGEDSQNTWPPGLNLTSVRW